jgi:N-dimethylarginine dimethylaminohydrolase
MEFAMRLNELSEKPTELPEPLPKPIKRAGPANLAQIYPIFLMCPPFFLTTVVPNNKFMTDLDREGRKFDREKMTEEFLDLYKFMSENCLVYLLPSAPGMQDQTYVANLGIVLPHIKDKQTVVLSNFRSKPRRDEPEIGRKFFDALGYKVFMAPKMVDGEPAYFEGEAELKYLRDNIYLGAHGIRTSANTLDWFRKNFDMHVIGIHTKDPYLYHLDTMLFIINREKIVVPTSILEPQAIREIEKVAEIIDIDAELARAGTVNCCRVGNYVLSANALDDVQTDEENRKLRKKGIELLSKICHDNGLTPKYFKLTEFSKSGADLGCTLMHLSYPEYTNKKKA